ncbi:kinase-like protein [Annulohypoxylon maeteangense]|uniref:kinase-like protein n=1 Tax=Annulohypoxylon maeteangense TaxID=1927788 RepID=UPI0020075F1F|nr:kinase-like protein [Annulohypoxylon maeteangense]KAI0880892.1 kinase-like protein [Annulohypoxylon maeteangense]
MAATSQRRVAKEPFRIHRDEAVGETSDVEESAQRRTRRAEDDYENHENHDDHDEHEDPLEEAEEEEQENPLIDDDGSDTESDDTDDIDMSVQHDMDKLQATFPDFKDKYRLIKRIGEGTFSTVYKAEDIQYHQYENSWDLDAADNQWRPPPLRGASRSRSRSGSHSSRTHQKPKFVAIKKIYVTSSPARILNELELLHDLRDSNSVCPLITAFRHADQVLAVLPYFRHQDFRKYYPQMTVYDMRVYFRSLFTALAAVHEKGIIHRDIKPTNFLYDPDKKRGVLVDFGLAEREGLETKPCLCQEDQKIRKQRLQQSVAFNSAQAGPQLGYPTNDTRPSRRANRAGTRGFRAPEVLFKCTEQTTKIDIWSAGVILLTILCRRFPFFNSADDIEAMIEIATIFGSKRMKHAGQLHGCMFETTIPTIGERGFSFEKIMLWSTCRSDGGKDGKSNTLTEEEKGAIEFLTRCMELDSNRRISAKEALRHEFLRVDEEPDVEPETEDDVMML